MNWKVTLWIIVFIAIIIGQRIETNSPEGQARNAAMYNNAAKIASEGVCDELAWRDNPYECRSIAKEKEAEYEKKFFSIHK